MPTGGADWEAKLDPRLRALLARAGAASDEVVHVLLRFSGPHENLAGQRVAVRTISGDIATATLALADVATLASDPRVLFVELATPLTPDRVG